MGFLEERLSSMTYSTAFSGIDAPGCALEVGLRQLCGERHPQGKPTHLYGVEWLRASQAELMAMPNPPVCLCRDISELWKPVTRLQ